MNAADRHYADIMKRLTPIAVVLALVIQALTIAWLWHSPQALRVSIAAFIAMVPVNVAITHVLIGRWGAERSELLRIGLSATASIVTNHYTGWPLPIWLWLPFQGLSYDGHRRLNWVVLFAVCGATDVAALWDHVDWTRPGAFTLIAVMARLFTDARLSVLRDMFAESERQRLELDAAHARITQEIAARESIETELRQAQKLEAVGRLASGVAHEINTPVQFVGDSIGFVEASLADVFRVVDAYRGAQQPHVVEEEVDFAFLRTELPAAVALAKAGLGRVATIVKSMRALARPDPVAMEHVDVNDAMRAAATVAAGEYKMLADLDLDLEPLPRVVGHAGEVQQVFINLIVNAAHAIGETKRRGRITLRSRREGDAVALTVTDTGAGIPLAIRDRIFEPFFTTKEIGRGTGQGLALARQSITRHGGAITFESGACGTTFRVALPVSR